MIDTKVLPSAEVDNPSQSLDSLANRQFKVLSLIASGLSNKSIADRLGIVIHSVENYINQIYSTLRTHRGDVDYDSRVKAALMYRERYPFEFVEQSLGVHLTPREYEVLSLLAIGYSNARIAGELYVIGNTVESHIYHAYSKLGIDARNASYSPRVLAMLMFDRIPAPKGYAPRTSK